jgi:hypothetical protein
VAAVVLAAATAGCGDRPPAGVRDVEIVDPMTFHVREGFVRMEPPVHLPTSAPAIDQVEIWLRLPPTGTIELSEMGDEPGRLVFPPGTIADRVEFFDTGAQRRIVDIRGTTIRAQGQDFHAYRPAGSQPSSKLIGVQWSRDDAALQAPATQRFLDRIGAAPPIRDVPQPARGRVLESVRAKNDCNACHAEGRPDNTTLGEHGLVNRGTDGSGLFSPATVLLDEGLLETYGVDDRSTSDPALSLSCGERAATPEEIGARRCAGAQVMRGRVDWARLYDTDGARAERICGSRRTLWDRMSTAARARYPAALEPCEKSH